MSGKKISLISDFQDFITEVLTDTVEYNDSIDSLYKLIKFYYSERVDVNSEFFDPIAFIMDGDINDNLSTSSEESINNDVEVIQTNKKHLYDNEKYKKELELFLKSCNYY